jgi:hypothetical protein
MERQAFLIVTKQVLQDKRISVTAKLLLAQLLDHRNKTTGQCNPWERTLAKALGISRHTVMRGLKELHHAGLIQAKRGQNGNRYEFPKSQNATSQVANCDFPSSKLRLGDPAHPLYEPYIKNHIKNHKAAAAVKVVEVAAAAAAPVGGEQTQNPTPVPPAQKLMTELMAQHPEPGNLPKAVAAAEKLVSNQGAEIVQTLRRSHALWCTHWETFPPGRFIPQLWRWIVDGDWENPPADRKGVKSENWLERRERERKESNENFYRDLAEEGAWDVIRQYGGELAVEEWREKIKTVA